MIIVLIGLAIILFAFNLLMAAITAGAVFNAIEESPLFWIAVIFMVGVDIIVCYLDYLYWANYIYPYFLGR